MPSGNFAMGDDYGLYQHVQTSSKRQQGHAAEERLRRAQLALAMKATKESECAQGPPDAYPYRNPGQKLGSQSGSDGSSSLAFQLKEQVKGSLESARSCGSSKATPASANAKRHVQGSLARPRILPLLGHCNKGGIYVRQLVLIACILWAGVVHQPGQREDECWDAWGQRCTRHKVLKHMYDLTSSATGWGRVTEGEMNWDGTRLDGRNRSSHLLQECLHDGLLHQAVALMVG
ncbi:hypothetical protein V8C86DRAFT_582927 [Haematococcus lacustris]